MFLQPIHLNGLQITPVCRKSSTCTTFKNVLWSFERGAEIANGTHLFHTAFWCEQALTVCCLYIYLFLFLSAVVSNGYAMIFILAHWIIIKKKQRRLLMIVITWSRVMFSPLIDFARGQVVTSWRHQIFEYMTNYTYKDSQGWSNLCNLFIGKIILLLKISLRTMFMQCWLLSLGI